MGNKDFSWLLVAVVFLVPGIFYTIQTIYGIEGHAYKAGMDISLAFGFFWGYFVGKSTRTKKDSVGTKASR